MYHGMLTIRKEPGWTSSDVVARLRGILHMKKIGHTGTLDPDAEGVLPVCLGKATKLCELIADRDKEYRAVMRLGVETDTQDMSGTVLNALELQQICEMVSEEKLRQTAARFTGEILQIPPMYSAVKIGGKRLYEMARKGEVIERSPRPVTIYELEIEEVELPLVTMRIRCSKGTYIRTLCNDIGAALGTGAAMEHLLRTRVGSFTLEEAVTLDEAQELMRTAPASLEKKIRTIDWFFSDAPSCTVRREAMKYLDNGNLIKRRLTDLSEQADGAVVRMYGVNGDFRALYRYEAGRDVLTNYKLFFNGTEYADHQ